MNESAYARWRGDAKNALSNRYSSDEVEIILNWFDNIKDAGERELIGDEAVDGMLKFCSGNGAFSLYNSLMARAFVYAPLILKQRKTSSSH